MDPQNMGGEEVNDDDDDGELTTDEGNTNIRISTVRYGHALGRLEAFFFFSSPLTGAQLQLPGSEEGSASFEILGEDHTLGNALRYIIMKKYVGLPSLPPCAVCSP